MRVSVVVTVLNEAESLSRMLDSLAAQAHAPDEVVICDGGSTDGTLALLEAETRLPLLVIQRPAANISQGRNAAIEAATGDVIAVADAGVRLGPRWLQTIVAPFEDAGTQAVAGFFLPDPHTVFETALGATVLPELREINPARFLPSSRSVAFRKAAWKTVGGYPEWLDYCEDLIFDLRLQKFVGPFVFTPGALVCFRPRPNLRAFFVQYYRYARGDGKADLWRRRHAIRYLTYLVLFPGLVALALHHSPWWWLALALGAAAYSAIPYLRLWPSLAVYKWPDRLKALLLVPVIRVVGDDAKMVGYPVGLFWRWRNRGRLEIHWR
jgi:glycosyltransferase involved in cell wall biosynthesis